MAGTRIFVTQDAAAAAQTAGFWTGLGGHSVQPIGPTTPLEVIKAEDNSLLWTAPGAGDWYGVVVTATGGVTSQQGGGGTTQQGGDTGQQGGGTGQQGSGTGQQGGGGQQ